MSFIKVYPLVETENNGGENFGRSIPARCLVEPSFSAREYYLHVDQIVAFEECQLSLICDAQTDEQISGIRLQLHSGDTIIVPDDPEDEEANFIDLLERASQGEIVEMAYSRYLRELEEQNLI